MAKVKYTTLVPDDVFALNATGEMFATKTKGSSFELRPEDAPYYVLVEGHDLKYKHGYLISGTITDIALKDGSGADYLSIDHSQLKIDSRLDISKINPADLFLQLLNGNDVVTGSAEIDVLFGGSGKNTLRALNGDDTLVGGDRDTMTGNLGSDTFVFNTNSKKVVVTDFDAVGGGVAQDYLYYLEDTNPRIYGDHHNTVVDFGHGRTMTLLDVDRVDVSMDDFKAPPIFALD